MPVESHSTDEVLPLQRFWSDGDDNPWHLRLLFGELNGTVECIGLEMRSFAWPDVQTPTADGEPPGSWLLGEDREVVTPAALTTQVLRKLNLSGIIREAKKFGADIHRVSAALRRDRREEDLAHAEKWQKSLKSHGGRPRTIDAELLQRVASIYRQALDHGDPPTKAVAGKLPYSRAHAGRLVQLAREAGFLGPTTRGKAAP